MKYLHTIIVILATILLILFCQSLARAESWTDDQIADAIYKAENSKKYPYGVKSINTYGNIAYARKICLNSIKNAKKRYIKAGCKGDFIAFMGQRYSPPSTNPNWVRLVHYFLKKGG
jgi:hypothetical protein